MITDALGTEQLKEFVAGTRERADHRDNLAQLAQLWELLTGQEAYTLEEGGRLSFLRTKLTDEEVEQVAELCLENIFLLPQLAEAVYQVMQSAPAFRHSRPLYSRIYDETMRLMVVTQRKAIERASIGFLTADDFSEPKNAELLFPQLIFDNIVAPRRALQTVNSRNVTSRANWAERLKNQRLADVSPHKWPQTGGAQAGKIGAQHMMDDRLGAENMRKGFGPFRFLHTIDCPQGKWVLDGFTHFTSMPFTNPPELEVADDFAERMLAATQNRAAHSDIWTPEQAALLQRLFESGFIPPEYKYVFFRGGGGDINETAIKVAVNWKHRRNLMRAMIAEGNIFTDIEQFERYLQEKRSSFEALKQKAEEEEVDVVSMIESENDPRLRLAYRYLHTDNIMYFAQLLGEYKIDLKKARIFAMSGQFSGRTLGVLDLTRTDSLEKHLALPQADIAARIVHPFDADPALRERAFRGNLSHEEQVDLEMKVIADMRVHLKEHPDEIAAVLIENIQGEGGYRPFTAEFMQAIRQLADEFDFLFIQDEVQTGMGRASDLDAEGEPTVWSWQRKGFPAPDAFTSAKAFGMGGLFCGGIVDKAIHHALNQSSIVNSTFGGFSDAMVRTAELIPLIQEHLPHIREIGEVMRRALIDLEQKWDDELSPGQKLIGNVRPFEAGTMIAFDFPNPEVRNFFWKIAFENGLAVLKTGANGIRILPPFDIPNAAAVEMIKIIELSLTQVMEMKPDLSFRTRVPLLDDIEPEV